MNNYQFPFPPSSQSQTNPYAQLQQIQQMFPQPQGSVYSISAPLDIGNVPIGSTGLSVALCLSENLMYIKSFQNGSPVIMAYEITPFAPSDASKTSAGAIEDKQDTVEDRLTRLEALLSQVVNTTKGGKFDDLLQP